MILCSLCVFGLRFATSSADLTELRDCNSSDDVSLLQSKGEIQRVAHDVGRSSGDVASSDSGRILAIFYDGSGFEENTRCTWPKYTNSDRSDRLICETNVLKLARLATNDSRQLTYYEPGVGTAEDDNYNFGVGMKAHALNGYKWLAANYQSGDAIHVFGYSRGALSARYLQGLIHRVGVAKSNHVVEAIATHMSQDDARVQAFKANASVTFADARIAFMGLWEAVLRTLLHPIEHANVEHFHLKMTSTVSRLVHAIALEDYREIFQTHELAVDSSTEEKQVWFMGVHADVGGGYANGGPSQVPLGWMADEASQAGLRLRKGWQDVVHVNIDDDVHTETGLSLLGDIATTNMGLLEIRNPTRCHNDGQVRNARKEGWKLRVHRSVQDRMNLVKGWVPLPWCCAGTKSSIDDVGITWISNPHFDAKRQAEVVGRKTQWMKVHIGELRDVTVSSEPSDWFTNPSFYVKVQSWHTRGFELPTHARAPSGCCSPRQGGAPAGVQSVVKRISRFWQWPTYKASVDFTGLVVVLPREARMSDEVIVEVFEDDWGSTDDFVGRVELPFDSTSKQFRSIGNGKLEVWIEDIVDDEAVKDLLPGANLPADNDFAQCRWLINHLGMSQQEVCGVDGFLTDDLMRKLNFANADTCAGFLEDITGGA
jgi:hypothetical protein